VQAIAWAIIAAMAFNGVMAWRYFFAGPVAFSVVIVALLVAATLRKQRVGASAPATGYAAAE
jgi:hypothetical protein